MGNRVQLFVTCLVNGFFPEVGIATLQVLERAGAEVDYPSDQTCCGQPAFNAGFRDQARAMMRQTLEALDATEGPIVLPSGSCAAMLIHHGPELMEHDPELHAMAIGVADRVHELSSYLVDELGVDNLGGSCNEPVTYHASCHGLRGLGLEHQPQQLLDAAPGVERVELDGADECCGFGGLFSIEMPEVSAAILATKLDNLEASGAATVVGTDVSCLMHIGGGLRRRGTPIQIKHLAQVLAEGNA
ncbi:MAG TPA: (Fe-S)-binding protein [Acidimicrobiia bacterium]|jgi:L-lactate dehydrogenase complex protein LldE|nr:(Fe-S)-binding protein [Acidimicrobiia bacterium]